MIRGVNHIAVCSADIDRMARFYTDIMGFSDATDEFAWRDNAILDSVLGLKGSIGRQRMLRACNCYLELFEFAAPSPLDQPPLRACDRGYTHLALDVADIDAEVQRLKRAGVRFLIDEPIMLGSLRAIYGRDPDGNLFELIQAPPAHPYSLTQIGSSVKGTVA